MTHPVLVCVCYDAIVLDVYRGWYTLLSLIAPVACIRMAFRIIQRDIFYGKERGDRLREILHRRSDVMLKKNEVRVRNDQAYARSYGAHQ